MAMYYNQITGIWQDLNGKQCSTNWSIQDQSDGVSAGAMAVLGAAQALSSCKLVAVQQITTKIIGGTGVTGDYPTRLDRAMLQTRYPNSYGQIEIPGPKATVFLPDHKNIDYDNPAVLAFAAQVLAVLGDKTGAAVLQVYGGSRQKVRNNAGG